MALKLISPTDIQMKQTLPNTIFLSQAYYLGYGRNAWNSAWTNKYMTDCVSLSLTELQQAAERMRVQGSVFQITAVPMLTMKFGTKAFGIIPINERSEEQYSYLLGQWEGHAVTSFWNEMPIPSQHWLLTFNLTRISIEAMPFTEESWKSRSIGGSYMLHWESRAGASFDRFLDFAAKVKDRFKERRGGRTAGDS
jgi:hypothetical protein